MQSMPNTRAAGMLVFTTVAWGAMFAVAKSALGTLDAFWLSTWRYIPAAVVMLAILWLVEGRGSLSPRGALLRTGSLRGCEICSIWRVIESSR